MGSAGVDGQECTRRRHRGQWHGEKLAAFHVFLSLEG
jgi:hypothetical protein